MYDLKVTYIVIVWIWCSRIIVMIYMKCRIMQNYVKTYLVKSHKIKNCTSYVVSMNLYIHSVYLCISWLFIYFVNLSTIFHACLCIYNFRIFLVILNCIFYFLKFYSQTISYYSYFVLLLYLFLLYCNDLGIYFYLTLLFIVIL